MEKEQGTRTQCTVGAAHKVHGRDPMGTEHTKGVTLQAYADLASNEEFTNRERYRAIVVNLPRRLFDLEPHACAAVLEQRPELSGTSWDALLAAVAEHTALRDGHPVHPWMHERARFVDLPWFPIQTLHHMRVEALLLSPSAFLRHGTPVHPSDLDPRGGDKQWPHGA